MPDALAGVGAQRHDRVGEQVVAQPLAAEVVGARAARRHEDEVARRIGDDHRPGVGGPGARGAVVLPGVRADGRLDPAESDPSSISACPVTASKPRTSPLGCVVEPLSCDAGADDDGVADDGGRRGLLVVGEPARRRCAGPCADRPCPSSPKPRTACPVFASSAIRRASIVATKIRRSPPRCHVETPRLAKSP